MNIITLEHTIKISEDSCLYIKVDYDYKEKKVVETKEFTQVVGSKTTTKITFDINQTIDCVFNLLEIDKDFENIVDKIDWYKIYKEQNVNY